MTLSEFIKNLQEFIEKNPAALELEVITSKDSEGNGYESVYYGPSIGHYDGDDFIPYDQFEEWNRDKDDVNSVCLN
jgi:hypothetical protein